MMHVTVLRNALNAPMGILAIMRDITAQKSAEEALRRSEELYRTTIDALPIGVVTLNRDLRVLGLLPTFYDGRTVLAREMLEELREIGDHHVFNAIIRNTVKLGEAPLVGRPITSYAGSSEAARTYRELAREVIELGQA